MPPYTYISNNNEVKTELAVEGKTFRTVYFKGKPKGTILGEKCNGVRHFDCIGLVNYCLSMVLGKVVHDSIAGYTSRCPDVTKQKHLPGDIVIYGNHHIAFMLPDGKSVINATDTEYGVKVSNLSIAERADSKGASKIVRHPALFD